MPVPRRDLDVTRLQLLAWFGSKMPRAAGLRISELSGPATTGFSSDTLLFDLEWDEAGAARTQGFAARIKPSGFQVFPEYDIARQFTIQRALADTGVPVARMHWLEEDEGVLGAPFYVMEKIEGRIPTDNPPYHAGGWMTEVSPEERAAIWWNGLDVLARIHQLDWQALGFGLLAQPERGPTPLDQQLHYYRDFLDWTMEGEPHPVCEAALRWLQDNRPAGEPVRLAWGDARIGNMIFDGTRCVAVLDWEMVGLGSPEMDLAWFMYLDRHHSEGIGVPPLPGIPSRTETAERYEQLTGHAPAHLAYYEIFAGFRFSVIMARVAKQMKFYEMLPPEADFELTNPCARLLARIMGLPDPGGG